MSLEDRDYYREWLKEREKSPKPENRNVTVSRPSFSPANERPIKVFEILWPIIAVFVIIGLAAMNGYQWKKMKAFTKPTIEKVEKSMQKFVEQIPQNTTNQTTIIYQPTQNILQIERSEPKAEIQWTKKEEAWKTNRETIEHMYQVEHTEKLSNAEDNHQRIEAINIREKQCNYWRTYGIDHTLENISSKVREFCH